LHDEVKAVGGAAHRYILQDEGSAEGPDAYRGRVPDRPGFTVVPVRDSHHGRRAAGEDSSEAGAVNNKIARAAKVLAKVDRGYRRGLVEPVVKLRLEIQNDCNAVHIGRYGQAGVVDGLHPIIVSVAGDDRRVLVSRRTGIDSGEGCEARGIVNGPLDLEAG